MTLAAFIVFAVAVAAIAASHVYFVLATQKRLDAQRTADEGRQDALYRQHKANQQEIARIQRTVELFAERSRALHDDARLMHQRVDQHFAHPVVKGFLEQGASGNGG